MNEYTKQKKLYWENASQKLIEIRFEPSTLTDTLSNIVWLQRIYNAPNHSATLSYNHWQCFLQ